MSIMIQKHTSAAYSLPAWSTKIFKLLLLMQLAKSKNIRGYSIFYGGLNLIFLYEIVKLSSSLRLERWSFLIIDVKSYSWTCPFTKSALDMSFRLNALFANMMFASRKYKRHSVTFIECRITATATLVFFH